MIKFQTAAGHCDIPCKIYDPSLFLVAGLTVSRLIDLIEEEQVKGSSNAQMQIVRLIMEKEKQTSIVKDEVNTIWGDYFKEPQFKQFPDTHGVVHRIMQLASKCKQEPSQDAASDLMDLLNRFAETFWATKNIQTARVKAPYPPAVDMVVPILSSD